ncbi:MAG TPA: hypothetical protein VFT64_12260 [Rickettsiales bacterium]|nr:hypothetical protein [Rickettsiales bacterium]
MPYVFIVKDSSANRVEYLRAENIQRAFSVGQEIIKQGNEIIDISVTSSDDSPLTIGEIEQSLIREEHWEKEYKKQGKSGHAD